MLQDQVQEGGPLRRIFHILTGISLVIILFYLDRASGMIFISCLFLLSIIVEALRLLLPNVNRLFYLYFNRILRTEEENIPTGTVYYLGGVLLSLLVFDRDVVLLSMTILAIGDPAASTIGRIWGRHRLRNKSLEGTAAFFLSTLAAGFLFNNAWPDVTSGMIIIGAMAGAIAELLSTKLLNDNLLIPVTSALSMTAFSLLLDLLKFN